MDYPDAETMTRELVKVYANSKQIHKMVMDVFGEAPSVNRIGALRGAFKAGDPANKRKMPKRFLEIANGMSIAQIIRYFKCSHDAAVRWCAEAGIVPRKITTSHNARPVPDDFMQIGPTMTKAELKRYYNVKYDGTIDRWLRYTKITPRKFVPIKNRISQMGKVSSAHNIMRLETKDEYDIAADVLRRERFPVNHCNHDGSFNPTGLFWRVGWSILTPDELLQRAAKYQRD